jgi:hypothetical protein
MIDPSDAATRFVTFYSYKGGVGRSMALANVASWLVTAGRRRVFAIDFDLEAPGLAYYFARSGLLGEHATDSPGLVELLTEYRSTGVVPDISRFVIQGPEQLGGGRLDFLPAGLSDRPGYGDDLAALDWTALYETGFGFELMEHLRVAIVDGYQPDFALLDSRTGLHGIGAIATQQLPDVVVLLFALNKQNLDGTRRVLSNVEENVFGPDTGRSIRTLVVASPVYEPGLPEASEAIERAEQALGRPVDARIPFSSAMVYGEQVWRVDDRAAPQDLLLEYGRIGRLLVDHPTELDRTAAAPPAGPRGNLERLAQRLLEVEGYTIQAVTDPRMRVDLLVERKDLFGGQRVGVQLLRGTGRGQVGMLDEAARQVRRTADLDRVLVYTERDATKVLQQAAAREPTVSVVSLPDVLDRLIDWKPYLRWLADATNQAAWASHIGRLRLEGWPAPPPSDEAADQWLMETWLADEAPLLLLVGPKGAERGTLSRWLAHDMAQRALDAAHPTDGRIPVLLPLERYRKSLAADSLVDDFLSDRRWFGKGGRSLKRRAEAFQILNEEGRLLLIIDEIDTLPDSEAALRQLLPLVRPRSKVLVNRYLPDPGAVDRRGLPDHRVARFVNLGTQLTRKKR